MTASLYEVPQSPCPVDLQLDGNEGSLPPEDLFAGLAPEQCLRRYPSDRALRMQLADRFGVGEDQVAVTAGGDDALDRIVRLRAEPGANVVLPEPTFVMLRRYAAEVGAEIRSVAWCGGQFPVAAVAAAVDVRTSLVFVVSPNNPTGAVVTGAQLRAVSASAPDALVVVDLAYAEFADEDLTAVALELPNAIVVRTFSKAWGMAGCRVGFAIGPAERIVALRALGPPYPVSGLSLELVRRRLEQESEVRAFVRKVRAERGQLVTALRDCDVACEDGQGNFVLARSPRATFVRAALASFGIAVRGFGGGDHESLADAVRITCPGDDAAFHRLLTALQTALAPQAVLFDMDGVLADVRRSYRRAILETAASFGVEVTPDDVAAIKLRGQANDDWAVTQNLLAARDVQVSLEVVRERFEEIYQGDGSSAGLYLDEPLLLAKATLQSWSKRLPLAVVTGRPRADAQRFLEMHDLQECFSAVIVREDAALKPSPEPVRLAMQRLQVERAWMVGDTPDDVIAGRSAAALAIGCLPPGEPPLGGLRQSLHRAGAGIVLNQIDELRELLP